MVYWNQFFDMILVEAWHLVIDGDLNFSMGNVESWGPWARDDKITYLFLNKFIGKNMMDFNHPGEINIIGRLIFRNVLIFF